MKIIILEDEASLSRKIKKNFEEHSYNVTATAAIEECLNLISAHDFDALILDRMISGEDSLQRLQEFKQRNFKLPIIILSAIDSPLEKATALDLGADDYLAKPFEIIELIARTKKVAQKINLTPTQIAAGDLTLNLIDAECYFKKINLNLSAKEFMILKLLNSKPGKIFKKENIINEVWGYSQDNKTNIVEANINSLRRKLEYAGSSLQIKNTRFIGYWLET